MLQETVIGEVQVSTQEYGQDWRRSENFNLRPPANAIALRFETSRPADPIVFGLAKDIHWGRDEVRFEMLRNQTTTPPIVDDDLYFGGVSGAAGGFTVVIFAIFGERAPG